MKDADQTRAYMDHVDRGFRQLNEEMRSRLVIGHPAPGHGLKQDTYDKFTDKWLEWLEFYKTRPIDILFVGDDYTKRTEGFEGWLKIYRARFTVETMLMDQHDLGKTVPYTPYPKTEVEPPKKQSGGLFGAIGNTAIDLVPSSGKVNLVIGIAGVAAAAWLLHEAKGFSK